MAGGTTSNDFIPCNASAPVSACCASQKVGGDVCLDGGLCLAASGVYKGFIYANGCTDPTGRDSACPRICPDRKCQSNNTTGASTNTIKEFSDFWGNTKPDSINLLQCNPGVWCCRNVKDSSSCCDDKRAQVRWNLAGDNFFLPGLLAGNTLVSTNTTGGNGTVALPSPTCPSERASGKSATTIGAAVGATLGVALLAALCAIVWLWRKLQAASTGVSAAADLKYGQAGFYTPVYQPIQDDYSTGLQQESSRSELPLNTITQRPAEIP